MKKFAIVENGYSPEEVNAFVERVASEYETVLTKLRDKDNEVKSLQRQIEEYQSQKIDDTLKQLDEKDAKIANLEEQLEHYHDIESTLNKTILVAEESSNQIKKIARDEARLIIDDAKKNASHIVNDALIKAEKVELEADQLKRSLRVYKSRIKQAINDQLSIVDDVDKIKIDEE